MNIGMAGFLHETNTFAASRATFEQFVEVDAWPGLLCGQVMFDGTAGMNLAISGFIDAMRGTPHTLVPLIWCSANPCGLVASDAFERIAAMLTQAVRDAGPLDALFLDLHGAMVAEHADDGEGELLRRLRGLLGTSVPIVVALDFHANVTRAMLEYADAMVAYRTYPHVDMADTGRRAASLLTRLLDAGRRPAKAYRQLPFLIPMPWQSTLIEPAASLMTMAAAQETGAVWSASVVPGFALADIADCGPSVVAYADDPATAEAVAQRLAAAMQAARPAFGGPLFDVAQAVARAAAYQGAKCLVLADTQDNPGGGGAGDTTDLLRALVTQRVQRAGLGILCDPGFAEAAHRAGVGQQLRLPLGGASGVGAPPLTADYEIVALGDGRFTGTGPFYAGCRMDLGPMARVKTGGVEVVVSSRKQQAADRAMFRHVGADPAQYRVLVLKSSVHFRADFSALADEILVVAAPGVNTADLHQLRYQRLRPGVELL